MAFKPAQDRKSRSELGELDHLFNQIKNGLANGSKTKTGDLRIGHVGLDSASSLSSAETDRIKRHMRCIETGEKPPMDKDEAVAEIMTAFDSMSPEQKQEFRTTIGTEAYLQATDEQWKREQNLNTLNCHTAQALCDSRRKSGY